MRAYIGFDDTDNIDSDFGTGKIARRFENLLPDGCTLWGVVRQQLLFDERIPYTSHNSSACVIVDFPDPALKDDLLPLAINHIEHKSASGSDPGICLACEGDPALPNLISFGHLCTTQIVTQEEARKAASGVHLSGHGGTNDGIIGAAAAVGLTASGWSGRFLEFSGLRNFPDMVSVSELKQNGIRVVSLDRDAMVPGLEDTVNTNGWLRPRLWGGKPVLPVFCRGENMWESVGGKRRKEKKQGGIDMPGKIFYRERLKVGEGEKKPRFVVVAVAGIDMKVYGQHMRKKELEQIALAVGAELVFLKTEKKEKDKEMAITEKKKRTKR